MILYSHEKKTYCSLYPDYLSNSMEQSSSWEASSSSGSQEIPHV